MARAQEKEDLGIQKVTVTKSYTPSLSDAFKLNTEVLDLKALQPETRKLEYQPQEIKVVSKVSLEALRRISTQMFEQNWLQCGGGCNGNEWNN